MTTELGRVDQREMWLRGTSLSLLACMLSEEKSDVNLTFAPW